MIDQKRLNFEVLTDAGNQVGRSYGIVYEVPADLQDVYSRFGLKVSEHNADGSWELPMPARLIVDRDGIIRYADINPDYTRRPEPEETLEALKALMAQKG
jgi:peroxiredoxin